MKTMVTITMNVLVDVRTNDIDERNDIIAPRLDVLLDHKQPVISKVLHDEVFNTDGCEMVSMDLKVEEWKTVGKISRKG